MTVTAAQAAIGQYTALAADGTAVRLRPLRREERDLVAGFFAGLSAESRRRRFLQAMPRLPQRLLRHLADVDGHRHVAVVAEAGDQTAGIARFLALPGEPGTAEVAVTVADRFQGRGIGGLLVDALRLVAEQAGIGAFVCLVDPSNRPMLRLLRRRGVALRLRDGLIEGRQQLHPARDRASIAAAGQVYGITHGLQAISLLLVAVGLASTCALNADGFGRFGLLAAGQLEPRTGKEQEVVRS